jgi:glutathione S-transferase
MTQPVTLITIPFSHFCEKARWALDRAGVPYTEDAHAPLFHARATIKATKATGRRSRSTPILIDAGRVLTDSTEILQHIAQRHGAAWLYPNDEALAIEESLDKSFGPAVRALAYFHLLPDRAAAQPMLTGHIPSWQARAIRVGFPLLRALLHKGLRLDAANAERSRQAIARATDDISSRLADGRPYLTGDAFSAADLTFAALAGPLIAAPEHPIIPADAPMPAALLADLAAFLSSPAAAFARRMYQTERHPKQPSA